MPARRAAGVSAVHPLQLATSVRISAERARDARIKADKLACIAWNNSMLGFQG
jgi:hypothetical protein